MLSKDLPNVNSLVGNPDAERAATTADGPGTGITGIFLSTHNLAYISKCQNEHKLAKIKFIRTFYTSTICGHAKLERQDIYTVRTR